MHIQKIMIQDYDNIYDVFGFQMMKLNDELQSPTKKCCFIDPLDRVKRYAWPKNGNTLLFCLVHGWTGTFNKQTSNRKSPLLFDIFLESSQLLPPSAFGTAAVQPVVT